MGKYGDNINMATERVQIAVRLESWYIEAIKRFAERNKKDFSWAIRFLLECELNRRNYYRTDYEPDIEDLPLTNDIQEPGALRDSKTLELVIYKLDRKRRNQESMLENMEALLTPEQKQQLQKKQGRVIDGFNKKPLQVPNIDKIISDLTEETDEKGEESA